MRKLYSNSILLVIIVASIATFLTLQKSTRFKKNIKLTQDLQIEKIYLKDKEGEYQLRQGKIYHDNSEIKWYKLSEKERVLSLALFYQWLKEDPILFDQFLDVESFNASLSYMQDSNNLFLERIGSKHLYPMEFLNNFAKTSSLFRQFEEEKTEQRANDLLAAMKNTNYEYLKAASDNERLFQKLIVDGEGENRIYYLAGDTSVKPNTVYEDFIKIKENGLQLKKEIEKRKSCLEDLQCSRIYENYKKPDKKNNDKPNNIEIFSIEKIYINRVDVEKSTPFLIHSSCWKERTESYIFPAKRCSLDVCLDWPFLADGDYFTKIGKEEWEKELQLLNVQYRGQSSSAPYGCNDLTYKPKLRTINFVKSNFSQIFTPEIKEKINDHGDIINEGVQAEKNFFEDKYPSDEKFAYLADYYLYSYAYFSKRNLLDVKTRNELLRRANIMHSKMSEFNLILNRSAFHSGEFAESRKEMKFSEREKIYLTLNRIDYSITFLGFSKNVWKLQGEMQYISPDKDKSLFESDRGLTLTQTTAASLFGDETIKEWNDLSLKARWGKL